MGCMAAWVNKAAHLLIRFEATACWSLTKYVVFLFRLPPSSFYAGGDESTSSARDDFARFLGGGRGASGVKRPLSVRVVSCSVMWRIRLLDVLKKNRASIIPPSGGGQEP